MQVQSGCLKKYCECYQWGVHCEHCKCQDCKNFEEARRSRRPRSLRRRRAPSVAMAPRRLDSSGPLKATAEIVVAAGIDAIDSNSKSTTITPPVLGEDLEEPHAHALPSPRKIARRRPSAAPAKFEKNEEVRAFGEGNVAMDAQVVEQIFSYLDDKDLVQASMTSKTFERIALSENLWKYPEQPLASSVST